MNHPITFKVFLSNGQLKPGLIRSFLLEQVVETGQHNITLEDGSTWPLHKEPDLEKFLKQNGGARAIISFQVFNDGTYFAVARKFKERNCHA